MMRGVHWFLEQPGSSVVFELPQMKFVHDILGQFVPVQSARLWGPKVSAEIKHSDSCCLLFEN